MEELKRRIVWVDYAKILGLLLVIFAHLCTSEGTGESNIARTYIYGFHMPFFFLISGFLYKGPQGTLIDAIIKNVKVLFIPWLIFNILFSIIYGLPELNAVQQNLYRMIRGIYHGSGTPCMASWFVICLFIMKCVFDVLVKLKIEKWGIGVIFVLTCIPFTIRHFYVSAAFIGLVFFGVGYVVKPYLNKRLPWSPLLGVLLLLGSYCVTTMNGKVSVLSASMGMSPALFYLNAFMGSAALIFISQAMQSRNKYVELFSNASIAVVLTHMYFVKWVISFTEKFEFSYVVLLLIYSVMSVVIYGLCVLFFVITQRISPQIWGKRRN